MARAPLRLAGLAAALTLAACATVKPPPPPPTEPAPLPGVEPARPPSPVPKVQRRKRIPDRPIDLAVACRFANETGYHGNATVDVRQGEVHALDAEVNIPARGQCRFQLADFRQVKRYPTAELRAANGCVARVWEQGPQATVAFSGCRHMCSPAAAFDYVWPILIDRPRGKCD